MDLNKEQLEKLSLDDRIKVQKLIAELDKRKKEYPILDYKCLPYQQEFIEAIAARKEDWTPKYKFIIFLWGNGSWKTCFSAYATMLIAMWKDLCKKLGLPFIWEADRIKIYSTTWDNIRDNIDRKYLLWTWNNNIIKLPWYIDKHNKWPIVRLVRHDKEILKEVQLSNWTVITCWTYDQWQTRLQWWEPDFTWMDELPTRFSDLIEIFRWTRKKNNWQILISATPTNYNKKIHDYIFNPKFKDIAFIRQIDSLENYHADHSWLEWLSEEDKRVRRFGSFTPPEWLVFPNFNPKYNVISHINPKQLGSRVRFYWAVDFGFKHPTAFLFIAVDNDGHFYIFDMIYKSGILMKDLAKRIQSKMREHWVQFTYIVADSSSAQERAELREAGIHTKAINKKAKVAKTSFRAWGILKVNQLLKLGRIVISDKCEALIDELQTHHFKDNWDVEKLNDDALDALRYFVTEYTAHSEIKEFKKTRRKIARKAQRGRRY